MMTNIRWINRILLVALVIGLIALVQISVKATISGSAHDFTLSGWTGGQICVPCHTPHNADLTVADSPLWNHEVTTSVFTLYNSPTLDAGPMGQPTGVSRLCLSCHDGTVALDSYGGATGTTLIGAVNVDADFGTDLSNDHPISFTYDTVLATTDGELFDPATQTTPLGGTIQNDMLFGDSLECASCHDVHNTQVTAIPYRLLKIDINGSVLCLTCHDK